MSEFHTGQPSTRRLQKSIQEKSAIQITLVSGETLQGQVIWQDGDCICLRDESRQDVMVWRTAVLYIKL